MGKTILAPATGKRKRTSEKSLTSSTETTIQVVVGSYERVLHGFTAQLQPPKQTDKKTQIPGQDESSPNVSKIAFADSFLFNAHASAIRSLAVSDASDATPQHPRKRTLATGGTDERINLYQLTAAAPPLAQKPVDAASLLPLPSLSSDGLPRNREMGSLLHHNSTVTALRFPTKGKLLSAGTDNTIAITRVRDWTVLSTIRAPVPKVAGRPSGDTAAPGEVPAGISGIAVHPSCKLMISVGIGERCMRLWNLVTGKKAGVLTFDKALLAKIGEGKWRGGEGRDVVWSEDGEEFAVAFEKGVLVYGLDCRVRAYISIGNRTKVCKLRYMPSLSEKKDDTNQEEEQEGSNTDFAANDNILALSTEDGRVLLYKTDTNKQLSLEDNTHASIPRAPNNSRPTSDIPPLTPTAQLGTLIRGNRIKDFQIFPITNVHTHPSDHFIFITGTSDGAVTFWKVDASDLGIGLKAPTANSQATNETKSQPPAKKKAKGKNKTTPSLNFTDVNGLATPNGPEPPTAVPAQESNGVEATTAGESISTSTSAKTSGNTTTNINAITTDVRTIGQELGTYETGRRITCLDGFVMDGVEDTQNGQDGKKIGE